MTTGRFLKRKRLGEYPGLLVSSVLAWSALALLSAFLPEGSAGRASPLAASWAAQVFAGAALLLAAGRGEGGERLPWALFGGAVAARLAWDVSRVGLGAFGIGVSPAFQVALYVLSYALFFAVLLYLVHRMRQEMVSVALLDALSVMLTTGLLVWYFALDPGTDLDALSILALLARLVCDLGLLFLSLAALLTVRRPPFVILMTAGTALLLVADIVYVWLVASAGYAFGGAAEVLWSGGVMLLGFAVLFWGGAPVPRAPHVGDFGVALFWFGPLSPPLQYGVLLSWGAFLGTLPAYVLLGGAVLALLLAARMYAITRAHGVLARRQEALALQAEQGRILSGLHDTVKQEIHGASMMIEAALAAQQRDDGESTRKILLHALEASREASRDLSKPLDELGTASEPETRDTIAFLRERLVKLESSSGIKTHEDLRVPLEDLGCEETAVARQVFAEAVWNAARHSGAGNFWISMRREEDSLVLSMRDDGRGYKPEQTPAGLGTRLMAARAEGVGATLQVKSAVGEGTEIEVRFGERRGGRL